MGAFPAIGARDYSRVDGWFVQWRSVVREATLFRNDGNKLFRGRAGLGLDYATVSATDELAEAKNKMWFSAKIKIAVSGRLCRQTSFQQETSGVFVLRGLD